ncbi:MAG: ATP-dependent helicase [Candidatus Methanoperedens sp.]|nr:ATP-dependent helicase [Candidatus Methanoperedens sp.]
MALSINDNDIDEKIYSCLDLDNPLSFFLFAGAGSGKTRSLVNVLSKIRENNRQRLRLNGQQIAVITYTNAACDEIKHRLEYDPLFSISTIHSFVWELVKSYQLDIKKWIKINLENEIAELEKERAKGRPGTKTAIDREYKIETMTKRLEGLNNIKLFTYNPNGDNRSRDSLNHSEVINIGANFLINKSLMQNILTKKYPILLIDESQDTKKELIEAFFKVQLNNRKHFSLGLFGDTMQRIYNDGKVDLGQNLPDDWIKPAKIMNHRSSKRIIKLINKIRNYVDDHQQEPRPEKEDGHVRLFIVSSDVTDKIKVENKISEIMSCITGDELWSGTNPEVKILTLEHHMAARRMGFIELFGPLYKVDQLRTGLLDGSLPGLRFFTKLVLPLIKAKKSGDDFTLARIVRQFSPLVSKNSLKEKEDQLNQIKQASNNVNLLFSLWKNDENPRLVDILYTIASSGLFNIPESLLPIANRTKDEQKIVEDDSEQVGSEEDRDNLIDAWDNALSSPFSQIEAYDEYISDRSRFGTHQGVKGLEFPRVMVILDDEESKGFLFSYEKLFGAKSQSSTDLKNEQEGKETSIDRTRRLFYVTCSRAEKSLAIVAYTNAPSKVKEYVISQSWFEENEIEYLTI